MASLEHLSNDELRKKLKEYGISSPVTASTRSVLLKKLNHTILASKNSKGSKPLKLSFEEANNVPNNRRKAKSKSKSETHNLNQPSTNLSTFSSDEDEKEESMSNGKFVPPYFRRGTQNNSALHSSEDDLFNANDSLNLSSFEKKLPARRKQPYSRLTTEYYKTFSKAKDSVDSYHDSGSDSDVYEDKEKESNRIYSNENLFRKQDGAFGNDIAQKRLIASSYSPHSRINYKFKNNHNGLEFKNSYETSFGEKEIFEITSPDDIVSREPITSNNYLGNGQGYFERVKKIIMEHWGLDKEFWLPSVPILLLILLALFFCFIGLCYLNIHTPIEASAFISSFLYSSNGNKNSDDHIEETYDGSASSGAESKFPLCENNVMKDDCLSKYELEIVSEFIGLLEDTLLPVLSRQASSFKCGNTDRIHLTLEEMSNIISQKINMKSEGSLLVGLQGLAKLSSINPHWGIKSVEAVDGETSELIGFQVSFQSTEIICHILSAFYVFCNIILSLALGGFAAWLLLKAFRHYQKQAEQREQKSFELVEQILEVLENCCGSEGKEFMAVNHVRDCLIAPRERRDKASIWDKAVKFIDQHDSRVYREVQSVGGEECEVWRWVSGAPRSSLACASCPASPAVSDAGQQQQQQQQVPQKVWQGQAFESLETTQNVPQVSPTSCLKIRNMFDCEIEFGEKWPSRIQDSLLEKCEGVAVTHVAVDRVSKEGCVYVKCASPADAGKAFRALHGWWFDGNLVTVKYLREERYFERFPTARIASSPLTPSNNKRLSLQSCPTACQGPDAALAAPASRRGAAGRGSFAVL